MNTQQKLNHSSPIVQRVLRLRERINRHTVATEAGQARTNYQWQMWQKSDFSAYAEAKHQCKETSESRRVDAGLAPA